MLHCSNIWTIVQGSAGKKYYERPKTLKGNSKVFHFQFLEDGTDAQNRITSNTWRIDACLLYGPPIENLKIMIRRKRYMYRELVQPKLNWAVPNIKLQCCLPYRVTSLERWGMKVSMIHEFLRTKVQTMTNRTSTLLNAYVHTGIVECTTGDNNRYETSYCG